MCDKCKVSLSIEHIIIQCSNFTDAREILKNASSQDRALNEKNSKAICTSFRKINIFNKL